MLGVGKKLQKHLYKYLVIVPFSQPKNFICFLQIVLSPSEFTQQGGGGRLRCFVQWLSHVLCPMVSFCWLILHRLLTLHVQLCLRLFFVLQFTSSMGYIHSGMYLPPFGMKTIPRTHIPLFLHII